MLRYGLETARGIEGGLAGEKDDCASADDAIKTGRTKDNMMSVNQEPIVKEVVRRCEQCGHKCPFQLFPYRILFRRRIEKIDIKHDQESMRNV